ncbi:MAG: hypothetical protein UW18_C0012G0007 [Microgenomates group bacterium GW2011_GWF1_44_10]|nr:MAG: hypothetical protein UW18_C0012G0007 [Microgenomates group bacterium GW2011_GWF1_44_10]
MAIIISIDNVEISRMIIDYEQARVEVHYRLTDSSLVTWREGVAFFWATLPTPQPVLDPFGNIIGTQELPSNWFQLPPSYISLLIGLRNDADAALTASILGG